MDLRSRFGQAADHIRGRDAGGLLRNIQRGLYSDSVGVGIRKALSDSDGTPPAEAQHPIRVATAADIEAVLDPERGGASDADEMWQRRLRRQATAVFGPGHCYVADLEGKGPSFMQFLFFAEDNDTIQAEFPSMGPRLAPDVALVELLYLSPDARSLPLLTEGMKQVAEEARRRGAKSVITYTGEHNSGALLASQLAGFRAFEVRRSRYRFFRGRISYEPYTGDPSRVLSPPAR